MSLPTYTTKKKKKQRVNLEPPRPYGRAVNYGEINNLGRLVATSRTRNGQSDNENGERGTGNGVSLKWGIFKPGNL